MRIGSGNKAFIALSIPDGDGRNRPLSGFFISSFTSFAANAPTDWVRLNVNVPAVINGLIRFLFSSVKADSISSVIPSTLPSTSISLSLLK